MKVRVRDLLLVAIGLVPLALGVTLAAWTAFGPKPTLDRLPALAQAKRFDEAEAELRKYLAVYPNSSEAHLFLAQLCVERPDPKPELALEHLRKVHADDPRTRALVKLAEGQADYHLGRPGAAETAWRHALQLNPRVPEAGWSLIGLYYLEGRQDETRALALELVQIEPDPQDRVKLMLEPLRQDARPPDAASVVLKFDPIVRAHPEDVHAAITLGLALVHDSKADRGLKVLRQALADHPKDPEAWSALFQGLDDAHTPELLAEELGRLPADLAAQVRFARYKGRVALARGDAKTAAIDLDRAWQAEPFRYEVGYLLSRALRSVGETAEAENLERRLREYESARKELPIVFEQAIANRTLGTIPNPELYERLAGILERMGRSDESRVWQSFARGGTAAAAPRRSAP